MRSIDVVVPVFNRAATLERTVRSILAQERCAVRIVVVDDGSTDASLRVARAIDDERVHVVAQPNSGPAAARNHGARTGTAEWIGFVDADDEVDPSWAITLMDLDDNAGIAGCAARLLRAGRREQIRRPTRPRGPTDRATPVFLAGTYIVRRALFDHVGGFDERFRFSENTELAMRLSPAAERLGYRTCVTTSPYITINGPKSGGSNSARPAIVQTAAELMLSVHEHQLPRQTRSNYHAIAGVEALRQGDVTAAQLHLGHAVRLRPQRLRYWRRLAEAHLTAPHCALSTRRYRWLARASVVLNRIVRALGFRRRR